MADDDDLLGVAKYWTLEGHFVVGGSGLDVHTDCLGRTFTSRTASYDLTIGLPEAPRLAQAGAGAPPAPPLLNPPVWTYGPENERERGYENYRTTWGVAPGYHAATVYPESAKDTAIVSRCRFFTTLAASNEAQFNQAGNDFLTELDDWWTRFTAWVGILTVQDFVGLGGYKRRGTRSASLSTWTSNEHGQRAGTNFHSHVTPNQGIPQSTLQLRTCKRASRLPAPKTRPPPNGCSFAMRVHC